MAPHPYGTLGSVHTWNIEGSVHVRWEKTTGPLCHDPLPYLQARPISSSTRAGSLRMIPAVAVQGMTERGRAPVGGGRAETETVGGGLDGELLAVVRPGAPNVASCYY